MRAARAVEKMRQQVHSRSTGQAVTSLVQDTCQLLLLHATLHADGPHAAAYSYSGWRLACTGMACMYVCIHCIPGGALVCCVFALKACVWAAAAADYFPAAHEGTHTCCVAARSLLLRGSCCDSYCRVTTSTWCGTTLNLLSSRVWLSDKWDTHSSSSYGKKGLRKAGAGCCCCCCWLPCPAAPLHTTNSHTHAMWVLPAITRCAMLL